MRWQFIPFWKLTNFGFVEGACRLQHSCDEWHNHSRYIYIPLIGEVVRFSTINREGPWHLFAISNGVPEGIIVDDCDICQEILHEFDDVAS